MRTDSLDERSIHPLEPIIKKHLEIHPEGSRSDSDELLIKALDAIIELKKLLWLECLDWADDHSHLERICLKHLPSEVIYGNNYSAPGIIDFANILDSLIPQPTQTKEEENVFGECKCSDKFSIEAHGDGYALYRGRCCHKHGLNLAHITEADKATLDLIEGSLNHESRHFNSP